MVLITLSAFSLAPSHSIIAAGPDIVLQTGIQRYVTLLPKVAVGSPSPWLIYPTSSTIWVASWTTPLRSEIREFFMDGTSKRVVNLTNVMISSILADPKNPSAKVWFTENSTLAFYDTSSMGQTSETKAITFPNESLQALASDTPGRIWISMAASSGASTIAMYDPSSHMNQTYTVPTSGAIIQGISVNAPGDTIWFAEAGSKKLGRLVIGPLPSFAEFSPPAYVRLAFPIQVAVDGAGNVWFTDHASNQFGVFNPQTSSWKAFPIGYCPDNCVNGLPNSIFVDSKNMVWFSEHIAGRVGRFDPLTGILTEYQVPGSAFPEVWWAMPGPNNLVWFVAWGSGEIGYINASIPVPFHVSVPSADVVVQRGGTVSVLVQASSQLTTTLSFGASPVTQDQPLLSPAQVYGSSPSNLALNNNSQTVSFSISAAWNAILGPRYVALTASDGKVAVSAHVRVVVVEASVPFVALGFSSVMILGALTFILRKPKKPRIGSVKKNRR